MPSFPDDPPGEGLTTLRAMAKLHGTSEGLRTRRSLFRSNEIIAAMGAPYDVKEIDACIWTWTPQEGLVEWTLDSFKSWRPGYELYSFHTDEEWELIDRQTPHPNAHIFKSMARGASFMVDAPNPLDLLSAAKRSFR